MNTEKQVEYWKRAAKSDLETAGILIEKGKLREGLFFCHLCIEKILKAHNVQSTRSPASRTHNLFLLLSKTSLDQQKVSEELLTSLMEYQLEGRYPEDIAVLPSQEQTENVYRRTEELLEWLARQL